MNVLRRAVRNAALVAFVLVASACSEATVAAPETVEPTAAPTVDLVPTEVPAEEEATGPEPIRIGVIMALSGVMAQFDRPAIAGMTWQVDRVNEAGGVLDRPIELVMRDSESRGSVSLEHAELLIADGISVLMVSCDPGFARPVIERAEVSGVLTVSPCGSSSEWMSRTVGELSFSFGTSPVLEGFALAEHAWGQGLRTSATFSDESNPDSLALCQGFRERFTELGGTQVVDYEHNYDQLIELEERLSDEPLPPVDVVAICTHLPGGLFGPAALTELLRGEAVRFGGQLLGGSLVDSSIWLRAAPNRGAMTIVSPTSPFGDDPVDDVNTLIADLEDPSGLLVRGWTAQGADAIAGVALAIERAGSLSGPALAGQLAVFDDEQLVSRQVTFTPSRHLDPGGILRLIELTESSGRVVGTITTG